MPVQWTTNRHFITILWTTAHKTLQFNLNENLNLSNVQILTSNLIKSDMTQEQQS